MREGVEILRVKGTDRNERMNSEPEANPKPE